MIRLFKYHLKCLYTAVYMWTNPWSSINKGNTKCKNISNNSPKSPKEKQKRAVIAMEPLQILDGVPWSRSQFGNWQRALKNKWTIKTWWRKSLLILGTKVSKIKNLIMFISNIENQRHIDIENRKLHEKLTEINSGKNLDS